MVNNRFQRAVLIAASVILFSLTSFAQGVSFYVSPEGDDSWSGDCIKQPFATIQRARDAVRDLKKKSGLTEPVTVYIRGGIYELQETLIFKPEDSGTPSCPIRYVAYTNEKPVISGGKAIKAEWKQYKGNILVCDIPEAKDNKWRFRQLFINGKRMTRARTPNKNSYYRIEKTENVLGSNVMKYRKGDFKNYSNLDEVEVVIFHSWNESRLLVANVDEVNRLVTFTGPIGMPLGKFTENVSNRYYIENVLEGLDYPGEWYLDNKAGRLYLYPVDKMKDAEVRAPVIKELMRLQGNPLEGEFVTHLEFSGLIFSDAGFTIPREGIPTLPDVGDIYEPSAITLDGAKFCRLENNTFRNTGTYAIEITGDGNEIIRNEIMQTGGGGIITRSFGKEPNILKYNHIHDCGDIFFSSCGINIEEGGGEITNNLIHDISHSGIYTRHWRRTSSQEQERRNQEQQLIIAYNEIHDVGSKLNDCAGIFVRDSNIVINNNLIYNVYSYEYYENFGNYNNCGVPGWGIYLGCETRNTLVKNNIIHSTTEAMHVFFGTRNVIIKNNIFADSKIRYIRYETPPGHDMTNNRFIQNIIYNTIPYAEIYNINVPAENSLPVESDRNVIFYSGGKTPLVINQLEGNTSSWENWLNQGYERNSILEDPMFRNPKNHNYSLMTDSPALKVNFEAIDISNVGLRNDK